MAIALHFQPMPPASGHTRSLHEEALAGARARATFRVRGDRYGDVYLVKAEGELDLATADVLADELNRAEATDAKQILLDLSDLAFIDSTGIHVLVTAHRQLADGRLRLLPVNGQVRYVLDLTGVAGYLRFVPEAVDGVPSS